MKLPLAALLALLATVPAAPAAEPAKSWAGTWNNRKYNTNGQIV